MPEIQSEQKDPFLRPIHHRKTCFTVVDFSSLRNVPAQCFPKLHLTWFEVKGSTKQLLVAKLPHSTAIDVVDGQYSALHHEDGNRAVGLHVHQPVVGPTIALLTIIKALRVHQINEMGIVELLIVRRICCTSRPPSW